MKAPSLFVMGLAIGGLVVFGIRAASLDTPTPTPSPPPTPAPHEGHPAQPGPSAADPHAGHESVDTVRKPENEICPVMGNPVDPEVFVDYEGRRIGFCCPGCDDLFLAEPEKYLKKVDAELAERQAAESAPPGDGAAEVEPPPSDRPPENEICPVMGNPVDPEVYVDYEGRRIGFCCPGCDKVFMDDPEPYLKKVDAELEKRGQK